MRPSMHYHPKQAELAVVFSGEQDALGWMGQEVRTMQDLILKLYVNARAVLEREDAQSMSEYAMAVAVIAFGSVAGMGAVANSVGHTFIAVSDTFTSALR